MAIHSNLRGHGSGSQAWISRSFPGQASLSNLLLVFLSIQSRDRIFQPCPQEAEHALNTDQAAHNASPTVNNEHPVSRTPCPQLRI